MKLLDLFCGAGGAAMGYHRAGFDEIVGVDIKPQKRYPFKFVLGDALEYVSAHGMEFDAIHASPPCQAYSVTRSLHSNVYPMLIEETRATLIKTGRPYVIENVPGAPLLDPLMLCGTMFGLRVIRHRLFECNPQIAIAPASCDHWGKSVRRGVYGAFSNGFDLLTITGNNYPIADGRTAMDIDWMSKKELSQAIPPAYTEYIGRQLLEVLHNEVNQ